MLIDWFTVGAQVLNFLVLVWLMRRFLYKPILDAIDVREKRIAKGLADAHAKETEATKQLDEYQHKNEDFEQQRATLLTKASDQAKAEGARLVSEATKAADDISASRQEARKLEASTLNDSIRTRTHQEVFGIARKALTDLATVTWEESMTTVFIRRVEEMDAKTKEKLAGAMKAATEPAVIRSAFKLPSPQCTEIQHSLSRVFPGTTHVRFEVSPDLISGIELTANGQKVAWSIADYLTSLEQRVADVLSAQHKSATSHDKTSPEPDSSEPKATPKRHIRKPRVPTRETLHK